MMIKNPIDLQNNHVMSHDNNEALYQLIISEIRKEKTNSISFSKFMSLALYEPKFGYYIASLNKLGEKGDFVTAPEISPLFAQCLGRQCQEVFSNLGQGEILEIGAGTGKMAQDLLLFLEKKGLLPTRYKILEISPDLRQRQQIILQAQIPHLFHLIEWFSNWSDVTTVSGIIIANEVLDALPVDKFLWHKNSINELRVSYESDQFVWSRLPIQSSSLKSKLKLIKTNHFNHVLRYESELNLTMSNWVNNLSNLLQRGLMLIIDYGFPSHEYYHPDRSLGTLMCYYRHRVHTNPFILVGLQDITASVDFSLFARYAISMGLSLAGFTSQAAFLINTGLLQCIEECYNTASPIDINRQVNRLTSPNEMGELIKVMALTRDYHFALQGFEQFDKRQRL